MTPPPSSNEITMTDLPAVKPKPGRRPRVGSESEVTLTVAWRIPADSLIILSEGTREEEWVRVTESVGNGPYQITVVRLTDRQRWSARLRRHLKELKLKWKYYIWWPVADMVEDVVHAAEDAAYWLGETWRRRTR